MTKKLSTIDYLEKMDELRVKALENQDAVSYATYCDALGITGSDIEDIPLYEHALYERLDLESNADLESNVSFDSNSYLKELNINWSSLARTALKRFPEIQRGESVNLREIRQRLSDISKAGYPVECYSQMNKSQAWDYLMKIRHTIFQKSGEHCPDVLSSIKRDNEKRKLERFL